MLPDRHFPGRHQLPHLPLCLDSRSYGSPHLPAARSLSNRYSSLGPILLYMHFTNAVHFSPEATSSASSVYSRRRAKKNRLFALRRSGTLVAPNFGAGKRSFEPLPYPRMLSSIGSRRSRASQVRHCRILARGFTSNIDDGHESRNVDFATRPGGWTKSRTRPGRSHTELACLQARLDRIRISSKRFTPRPQPRRQGSLFSVHTGIMPSVSTSYVFS
jgi:hypothetical protein